MLAMLHIGPGEFERQFADVATGQTVGQGLVDGRLDDASFSQ